MPLIKIESAEDPRIAHYVNLRDKSLRERHGRFIAEGELVVRRLLASRFAVESLLVPEHQLQRIPVAPELPVYYASAELIAAIAGFPFHRGVLACGVRAAADNWWSLLPPREERATVVVCTAVRDPANLGGILRNCAAFGVRLVLAGHGCEDPYARRVLRASMAAALKLDIEVSSDLDRDLTRLRDEYGFHCMATTLDPQALLLTSLRRRPPRLAIVLGNELSGIRNSTQQICRSRVTIPMSFDTDSLNVAAAAGVFLYHFTQLVECHECA